MESYKLLQDIGKLTKNYLEIELLNQKFIFQKPNKILITNSFFRNGICQRCGLCCRKLINSDVQLFWGQNEYYDLSSDIKEKLVPIPIFVNGKIKYLFQHKNPKKNSQCIFLDYSKGKSLCSIQDIKPIHCALDPIWIDNRKGNIYIHKRPRMRNWRFGCKMIWEEFNFSVFQEDIVKLNRLKQIADYFEIETYLDGIIDYLNKCLITGKYEGTKII